MIVIPTIPALRRLNQGIGVQVHPVLYGDFVSKNKGGGARRNRKDGSVGKTIILASPVTPF